MFLLLERVAASILSDATLVPMRDRSSRSGMTRTMAVELDVLNRDCKLSPGSFSNVPWPVDRSSPTLFVPASALTTDQQQPSSSALRTVEQNVNRPDWTDRGN
jgi:hypothetical protein